MPPAPGPAQQPPPAATSPSPTPTATPPPTATPTATAASTSAPPPATSPSPTPPPAVTPTTTPEPTHEVPGIEFEPLTRGEPRTLPADIALYYQVAGCMACGWGFGDVRRVVFDEATGVYREDRPLAFFDGRGEVIHARVSLSGQEMAAMICHVGSCAGTHAPVSAEALQHLWMSRDAGWTWDDLGPVAASSRLSGDSALFGEESSASSGAGAGRTVAWRSMRQGYDLFAVADEEGAIQRVFGAEEPLGDWARGVSTTGDLVVWWAETYSDALTVLAGAEMIDLESATSHEVAGLSLPLGFDPEADGEQDDFYYLLMGARPAPVIELTMGEPRALPAGIALYFWVWPCTECDAGPTDLGRVMFDEASGALRFDRPLIRFDDVGPFPATVRAFGVSESGQTMAAAICEVGFCFVCGIGLCTEYGFYPTIDAELRLHVSRDGGLTWDDWGLVLPGTTIAEVTDEDVRLRTRDIWDSREHWGLNDAEWEQMLARLAPLGLGELERGEYWDRWVVSGEEEVQSVLDVWPPVLGRVDWLHRAIVPGRGVVGSAEVEGVHVLAIVDASWQFEVAVLDIETLTLHPVDGLSMRTVDFFAARPAPD